MKKPTKKVTPKAKSKAPKIVRTCTYRCSVDTMDDGTSHLSRTNSGFNALELLGLLEKIQLDIMQQIAGAIKPSVTTRTVIEDK